MREIKVGTKVLYKGLFYLRIVEIVDKRELSKIVKVNGKSKMIFWEEYVVKFRSGIKKSVKRNKILF